MPDIALGDGYERTEANPPRDVIVMSAECWEFPPETFNKPWFVSVQICNVRI